MNTNYVKGRNAEYRVMRELEAEGYLCIRSAGSHKAFDVVAFLTQDGTEKPLIRAIQVKTGKSPTAPAFVQIREIKLPAVVRKELWVLVPRKGFAQIVVE